MALLMNDRTREKKSDFMTVTQHVGSNDLEDSGETALDTSTLGGHKEELERNFSLLSICGVGLATGNSW